MQYKFSKSCGVRTRSETLLNPALELGTTPGSEVKTMHILNLEVHFEDGSKLMAHDREDAIQVAGWASEGERVNLVADSEESGMIGAAIHRKVLTDLYDPRRSAACFAGRLERQTDR